MGVVPPLDNTLYNISSRFELESWLRSEQRDYEKLLPGGNMKCGGFGLTFQDSSKSIGRITYRFFRTAMHVS
jgi:hypothetical protein